VLSLVRRISRTAPLVGTVVIAALGVAAATAAISSRRPATSITPRPGFVGLTWVVTSVEVAGRALPWPHGYRATIAFAPDGRLQMDDGINVYSGRYELTNSGFDAIDVMMTLAAYAGHDRAIVLTIDALGAIGSSSADRSEVSATLAGRTLVVRTGRTTLRLSRVGRYDPPSAVPPPSTTP
jgi:heat shock protein HslJ